MSASYSIGDYRFRVDEFFPKSMFDEITNIRIERSSVLLEETKRRVRRDKLTKDGKLTILAADHPARMVTRIGDETVAMGDRYSLLGRILRVITDEEIDGVMSTPDIIEELLMVNHIVKENGGRSFLDRKVILGCMNRGGLSGTVFEMDDRMTAYTPEAIQKARIDGAKIMFRLETGERDSGSTIAYCAQAINELNKLNIPIFVEALPVKKEEGKYKSTKSADPLIQVIGVVSGLGCTSINTWLKINYCEDFQRVARATTCPILLLGGEASGDPTDVLKQFFEGMKAAKNVRGALVGRNITYPGNDDPLAVALAVSGIVHQGLTVEKAVERLVSSRGKNINLLNALIQ